MRNRIWMTVGASLVLLWVATEVLAGRGGGGGGGGGGRGGRGGARPSGGGARPGGGMPAGGNRTPSFSPPSGGRPAQAPSRPAQSPSRPVQTPSRPAQTPSRPAQAPGGGRPEIGSRPAQPPAASTRPGGGGRPQISTLPSTRPDVGGRPGVGSRPGISTLPAIGAGVAAGAGLANRGGDRPATLPGLGEGRPGASQLPARTPEQRRDALHDRLGGQDRPGQQPARDWNQQRQDWQQHRDEVRNDWQEHRDQARDDWQNWFDDHYRRYSGWYGGYAPGYWNRWDYLWDSYPVAAAAGLTWWGVNSLGYQFGCSNYYNPYYTEGMPAYYTEPVLTLPAEPVQDPAAAVQAGVSPKSVAKFDQARGAFLESKYNDALKLTDEAIAKMPRDAVLHEFRSLVLFALGRYSESAAAIHPVLDVGPGWDWKTMSSLYPNTDTYTTQLRALEAARGKDPKAADLLFLAGYHYLTLGDPDAAVGQFRKALELQPKDAVAAALVATLSPRDGKQVAPSAAAAPKPSPRDNVVGTWTAAGPGSANYSMALTKDGAFTWRYSRGARKQEAKGVYTVEGNVLAMEPDSGGVLLAEVTVKTPDSLHFKMVGGAKDDPGLEFQRGQSK